MNRRQQKPPSALRGLLSSAANVVLHSEPARSFARYLYDRTGAHEADAVGFAFYHILQVTPGIEGVVVIKFKEDHPTAEMLSGVLVARQDRPWVVAGPVQHQAPPTAASSGPAFASVPPGGPHAQG